MAYDVVVIGTGPGGYVCAIKAAQLGLKDGGRREARHLRRHLPQHRLHPSKALLHASEMFAEAGHSFEHARRRGPASRSSTWRR